jgi:hypothetical protein
MVVLVVDELSRRICCELRAIEHEDPVQVVPLNGFDERLHGRIRTGAEWASFATHMGPVDRSPVLSVPWGHPENPPTLAGETFGRPWVALLHTFGEMQHGRGRSPVRVTYGEPDCSGL